MLGSQGVLALMASIWTLLVDVAQFWRTATLQRIFSWWNRKKPRDVWLQRLAEAETYEEYEDAALQLDAVLGNDLWRQNPTSKFYDYRLIYERREAIIEAWEDQDVLSLVSLLRSGLVRNLGNISAPRLYNRAYAGTKLLIEDYITQVALAIEHVTAQPTAPSHENGFTLQAKLDLLHDTRQAFGRSTLVLRGGAIFGLCHLGVVKALHLRGLLPRILTGTGTGALIAALVGIHTEEELLPFLTGETFDLSAFAPKKKKSSKISSASPSPGWLRSLDRRIRQFIRDGFFLDVQVLEECVRANVGDLTFEEAYVRTKRVLNITVSTTGTGGVPNLLNYLTAPNVLIWSAALASNASASPLHSPITLVCKDDAGAIVPWAPAKEIVFNSWTQSSHTDRDSPLARIAELFNVNHFIVSHARPYLAPFLRSDLHRPSPGQGAGWNLTVPLLRLLAMELRHRVSQVDSLGLLPVGVRRFLIDDSIPGASLTSVPELTPTDFLRLLDAPSREGLHYWIRRGERSVWPAIGVLKVRCAIEVELDRGYQLVRRRKPLDLNPAATNGEGASGTTSSGRRKRIRASSEGGEP
ncbi:MAG: hypothetical protein M1832_004832 [Thelocarpon impressellum]|nr:MAG: hypothetical protein M1832_004832 [Thelocarpon impressellum]